MLINVKKRLNRDTLLLLKKLVNWRNKPSSVLFVAGMQRSGTNMLMDALESSLVTDVYHEWDERAFTNYQMKDRAVIHRLFEQSRGQVFTIKALCEVQDLTELMSAFKPAKVIWIFRKYEDVVNSMMRSFANMDQQIIRLADDPNSEAWLGKGMSEATHAILKRIVRPGISLASASALQWYIRNVLFFEQHFETNEKVLPVIYEDLVGNPVTELRKVFEFSGIQYSGRISANIHGASVGKQQPMPVDEQIAELCASLQERIIGL